MASPVIASAPDSCSIFADTLLNPSFITFDDAGNLYVSEAGNGGPLAVAAPVASPKSGGAAQASTPAGREVVTKFGLTGLWSP